ncbi:hypothetical protein TNCV_2407951 [Trichonephila clavipes]|nr:hypothetical protein TNCV_2407951 [Trichonephila clavipes]
MNGHVLWFRTSKGSDARNVQRMMIREHFGQQLHNTLFSVSVEVNNLRRLQAVDNDSKLRHKRNEIKETHSLVFDQVYLKCMVGLHVYERLASESCFYTREKQEVAFDWLDSDEREAERGFGWAMKDNGAEPLCPQERVQQNSVCQWVGKEGRGFLSQRGLEDTKKIPSTAFSIKSWTGDNL